MKQAAFEYEQLIGEQIDRLVLQVQAQVPLQCLNRDGLVCSMLTNSAAGLHGHQDDSQLELADQRPRSMPVVRIGIFLPQLTFNCSQIEDSSTNRRLWHGHMQSSALDVRFIISYNTDSARDQRKEYFGHNVWQSVSVRQDPIASCSKHAREMQLGLLFDGETKCLDG